MSALRVFFKRLFCRHRGGVSFVRNIYGDEIIEWGWKRSLWRCKRCGSVFGMDFLNAPPPEVDHTTAAPPQPAAKRPI